MSRTDNITKLPEYKRQKNVDKIARRIGGWIGNTLGTIARECRRPTATKSSRPQRGEIIPFPARDRRT